MTGVVSVRTVSMSARLHYFSAFTCLYHNHSHRQEIICSADSIISYWRGSKLPNHVHCSRLSRRDCGCEFIRYVKCMSLAAEIYPDCTKLHPSYIDDRGYPYSPVLPIFVYHGMRSSHVVIGCDHHCPYTLLLSLQLPT